MRRGTGDPARAIVATALLLLPALAGCAEPPSSAARGLAAYYEDAGVRVRIVGVAPAVTGTLVAVLDASAVPTEGRGGARLVRDGEVVASQAVLPPERGQRLVEIAFPVAGVLSPGDYRLEIVWADALLAAEEFRLLPGFGPLQFPGAQSPPYAPLAFPSGTRVVAVAAAYAGVQANDAVTVELWSGGRLLLVRPVAVGDGTQEDEPGVLTFALDTVEPLPTGAYLLRLVWRGELAREAEFHVLDEAAFPDLSVGLCRGRESRCVVDARLLQVDAAARLRVAQAGDVEALRAKLVAFLWDQGGLPMDREFDAVRTGVRDEAFDGMPNLARIDEYTLSMEFSLDSVAYLFRPLQANGAFLVYHSGHEDAGFWSAKARETIAFFLEQGYAVMAFSMPLTGKNPRPIVEVPGFGLVNLTRHDRFRFLPDEEASPVRFFVEPVVAGVNLALREGFRLVAMTGLSGGGWTTVLAAAIDPRIQASYPVAGAQPLYVCLLLGDPCGDYEQTLPALYRIADYLDLAVLGAVGPERAQRAILNQFDPCCFAGVSHRTYVDALRERAAALGGSFDLLLDSTHTGHVLSPFARGRIAEDLAQRIGAVGP
ncbi:MAG TPA: hypothetical protein VM681_08025 [Candidatus Thermoplasmatota archaeon]|nr:hypothetical protein [Candidatus Thermoplasmatota archaeon]